MAGNTVGTTGRDHSTLADWYSSHSGDSGAVVAEVYDDGDITETSPILWSSTTPSSYSVAPASGQGHTGVKSTGATFILSGGSSAAAWFYINLGTSGPDWTFSQLEIEASGCDRTSIAELRNGGTLRVTRCLVYDYDCGRTASGPSVFNSSQRFAVTKKIIDNNIIANTSYSVDTGSVHGIYLTAGADDPFDVFNNTIAKVDHTNGTSGDAYGFRVTGSNDADLSVRNIICYDVDSTAGTATDFAYGGANPTHTNNLSQDATADDQGTSHQINATLTFQNAASGDYRLVAGDTAAIDNGADLGATYETDIEGNTRSGTWDIGAHEFVSAGGVVVAPPSTQFNRRSSGRYM